MSQRFLTYITTWLLLFQLLVEINCQTTLFKPKQRYDHTATLIDHKLYILGGLDANGNITDTGNEFFYLDFTVIFNTTQNQLSWQDLTNINTVPEHYSATTVKGGVDNSTLFLYGGVGSTKMELVYTFDPQINSWSTPNITGKRMAHLTGIINNHGKMYLWGGMREDADDTNAMLILDTVNLSLKNGNSFSAPIPRQNYGAILLPNNNIIYLGGYDLEFNKELELNEVFIYDTLNDNWSSKLTTGKIPSSRDGFSAVLGLDSQRIIIFGGSSTNAKIAPEDSLYILDLNNFEWSIPKISGNIPNNRIYHKANVVGKYMVISFGKGYDQLTESDILLLDIGNNEEYVWTNYYNPLTAPSSTPITTANNELLNNISIIIGIIMGSLFGCILLSIGGFYLYKWNKIKRKPNNAVLIPRAESSANLSKYGKQIYVFSTPVINIGKTRFSIAANV